MGDVIPARVELSGWTNPVVQARYEAYLRDHYGELDIPNLCETIAQWSSNRTVEALVTFSDIGPQLGRLEMRLNAMHRLVDSLCAMRAEERDEEWRRVHKVWPHPVSEERES